MVLLLCYFYKDRLPSPAFYNVFNLSPPVQTTTDKEPFTISENGEHYLIKPKYDYQLTGVVVTYNDASQLGNIWHHRRWKDFINVRDLCVIWGDNVKSGIYQKLIFDSDSWTCWVYYDVETSKKFNSQAYSNNHILTNNDKLKEMLLNSEVGDVVQFKGWLSEYENMNSNFKRKTSITRTDSGNGACETVYLNDFQIIRKANSFWRNLYTLAFWSFIFSFSAYVILFIITPFRSKL